VYIIMYTLPMRLPKIKSATELRANLFETLREVQEGEPQLITHTKGSDGVILISQGRLNKILEENEILKSIALGRADVASGRTVTQVEATKRIKGMQAKWRK
jgi:prevent-host-death family protein